MKTDFLTGVIEGFYGTPWTLGERHMVLDWMQSWKLNTYLYAPKDDLKQRVSWREDYSSGEAAVLKDLIQACQARGIRFVYALSPGLDMAYAQASDLETLQRRLEQVRQLGGRDFALLFDDIPDVMRAEDRSTYGSFAKAQCHVTNAVYRSLQEKSPGARFLFCPTPYCGRMQQAGLGGEDYLGQVGRILDPGIEIFWTGPEIISSHLSMGHVEGLTQLLRRPPLIWDNLHANDYDGRRFYCGPYSGRPLELRQAVRGILHNPNNEAPLNYVPWKTLSDYVHADTDWDPRTSYLRAMEGWHARFESAGSPIALEDLVLLGDCFYLPEAEGSQAQALHDAARDWLRAAPGDRQALLPAFREPAARLRNACAEIVHLKDRGLFSALSRKTWDLREEMDLMLTCASQMEKDPGARLHSDYHLPGTYRGGMVSKLQGLLHPQADGSFIPSR
ncbi:MAG: beta-N-acetylglucosaminidase domain-containing protein [Verrucomicrobiota bacterium]|nr:beta-N-acetylglucosaminidase domain-containing protein [Verrucomicrobiota bacterium]